MTETEFEWFKFNETFVCEDCDQEEPRHCQGDCKPKCPIAREEATDSQEEEDSAAGQEVDEPQSAVNSQIEVDSITAGIENQLYIT